VAIDSELVTLPVDPVPAMSRCSSEERVSSPRGWGGGELQ
jgi:hypothetical protein